MARNIRVFQTEAAYQTEVNNLTLICPNMSHILETGKNHYLKSNPETGVGIKDVSGNYYTREEWNALSTKPSVIGVYVRSDNAKFCIGNTVQKKTWSNPYNITIPGCFIDGNQTLAKLDYNGVGNTDAIMAKINDGSATPLTEAAAAQYCRNYNFGVAGVTGYLLSCGELYTLMQNFTEVNLCRVALGWAALPAETRFWSSSQFNFDSSWFCSSSSVSSNGKVVSSSVVPACAL